MKEYSKPTVIVEVVVLDNILAASRLGFSNDEKKKGLAPGRRNSWEADWE